MVWFVLDIRREAVRDNTELVRRMAHLLTSKDGRDFLDHIGYEQGTPIVSVDSEERLVDTFHRVYTASADHVLLAVHFRTRRSIAFLAVARDRSARARETLETDSTSESTIGMLVDDIDNRGAELRVVVRKAARMLEPIKIGEYSDAWLMT